MDYEYIETLVRKSKEKDLSSTNELVKEFTPYIRNLSRKTHLAGYDYEDLSNECFTFLLKAINKYDINKHRFVSYACTTIKNNLYILCKRSNKLQADSIDYIEEFSESSRNDTAIENIIKKEEYSYINQIISKLSPKEFSLFKHLFVNNKSIKEYAKDNNIHYQTVYYMKCDLIYKLKNEYRKLANW